MQQCMQLTNTNRSRAYPKRFHGVNDLLRKHKPALELRKLVSSFEGVTTPDPFGGNGEGEPRVPISNTTVKPFSADGTWTAGSWESRTSPSTKWPVADDCGRFFVRSGTLGSAKPLIPKPPGDVPLPGWESVRTFDRSNSVMWARP